MGAPQTLVGGQRELAGRRGPCLWLFAGSTAALLGSCLPQPFLIPTHLSPYKSSYKFCHLHGRGDPVSLPGPATAIPAGILLSLPPQRTPPCTFLLAPTQDCTVRFLKRRWQPASACRDLRMTSRLTLWPGSLFSPSSGLWHQWVPLPRRSLSPCPPYTRALRPPLLGEGGPDSTIEFSSSRPPHISGCSPSCPCHSVL